MSSCRAAGESTLGNLQPHQVSSMNIQIPSSSIFIPLSYLRLTSSLFPALKEILSRARTSSFPLLFVIDLACSGCSPQLKIPRGITHPGKGQFRFFSLAEYMHGVWGKLFFFVDASKASALRSLAEL